MRGISVSPRHHTTAHGLTPAYAGNIRGIIPNHFLQWAHPRLCGEYVTHMETGIQQVGSPPLMRGISGWRFSVCSEHGLTPAYAGNIRVLVLHNTVYEAHPRLCGEYSCRKIGSCMSLGSPPLMRGISIRKRIPAGGRGLTPVCTGNIEARL